MIHASRSRNSRCDLQNSFEPIAAELSSEVATESDALGREISDKRLIGEHQQEEAKVREHLFGIRFQKLQQMKLAFSCDSIQSQTVRAIGESS